MNNKINTSRKTAQDKIDFKVNSQLQFNNDLKGVCKKSYKVDIPIKQIYQIKQEGLKREFIRKGHKMLSSVQ